MTSAAANLTHSGERAFFMGMAVVSIAVVFYGFSPTFFLRGDNAPPLSSRVLAHGIVYSAWMLLFLTQTSLIAADRRDLHKRLGIVGAGLAVLLLGLGTMVAVGALRRGLSPMEGLDPRSFFAIPMHDMLNFAVLVAAGFLNRRNAAAHKRLMLLATLSLLDAAFARFPLIAPYGPPGFYAMQDSMILVCAAYDLVSRRRVHLALVSGGLLIVLTQGLSLAISGTPLWLAFADWCR